MKQLLKSRELLKKAEAILLKVTSTEDEYYQDRKPVKRAGNLSPQISEAGLEVAEETIDRVEQRMVLG